MCHHSFFVSFTFTDYKEERGREKKTNKERKTLRHIDDETNGAIKKSQQNDSNNT
jgi:hypothetical protein